MYLCYIAISATCGRDGGFFEKEKYVCLGVALQLPGSRKPPQPIVRPPRSRPSSNFSSSARWKTADTEIEAFPIGYAIVEE